MNDVKFIFVCLKFTVERLGKIFRDRLRISPILFDGPFDFYAFVHLKGNDGPSSKN